MDNSPLVTRGRFIFMRTAVYIDGFNLFYALKRLGWRHLYWLDLEKLGESLCPEGSELAFVRYYTSRAKQSDSAQRQAIYLEALASLTKVRTQLGKFELRDNRCRASCQLEFQQYQEKETDVSIGVDLTADSFLGHFDHAVLVTGDTDQIPTLRALKQNFPNKPARLAFPPQAKQAYVSRALTNLCDNSGWQWQILTEKILLKCQLPSVVHLQSGRKITRPSLWARNSR